MIERKAVTALLMAICVCALSASTASAAQEFSKVGSKISAKTLNVFFGLEGGSVTCGSGTGSGEVASAKEARITMKYEECKASLGTEGKEAAATVKPCTFAFSPEKSVVIKEGCAIETGGCLVEQASETSLGEVGFLVLKEEGTPEADIDMGVASIADKVNKTCETLGVKASKAGLLDGQLLATGVDDDGFRKINVKDATTVNEKQYKYTNTTQYQLKFAATGKAVICNKFWASGKTSVKETNARQFLSGQPLWAECTNNIVGTDATISAATSCTLEVAVFSSFVTGLGPYPGWSGWTSTTGNNCSVTVKAGACTITFSPYGGRPGELTNNNLAPETVTVKEAIENANNYSYGTNGAANCPGLPVSGGALGKVTGVITGVNAEVKVV